MSITSTDTLHRVAPARARSAVSMPGRQGSASTFAGATWIGDPRVKPSNLSLPITCTPINPARLARMLT